MDIKQYHTLWNEAWKFFRHYAEQFPLPDDAWDNLFEMMKEYGRRHPENEYAARQIIVTVYNLLDHEDKQLRRITNERRTTINDHPLREQDPGT